MPLEGANIQIQAPERRQSTDDLFNAIARSLGRLGGGGGGGAGGFDYVFNPATGGYELMPHSRSNAINQYNLEQLQKYRARQAVANDASIAEKLKDFNMMSAEKQASTIESLRTQDLPRLQQETGIDSQQLIDAALTEPARVLAERRAAIKSQGRLSTLADTFLMGFGGFTDAIADYFSNTEEQLARAERRAESNRRIIERNPYLENRERQRAEGAGALDLLGTGGLHEAGALLGEFAGASGGPLLLAGGTAGLAARAGARFLPAATNAATQAARARAIQRISYAGGAVGGAAGGAPAQRAAVTSAIANDPTLTREEKVAALDKANTAADVVGALSGALVLPTGALVNRGISSLRAQAGRGGSNVAQAVRARNAVNGEIPAGQPSTYWQDVLRNARARDIAAENARLTAPGWRGRWNRYRASLPDSMLESTAFGVGLNTATNTIVGEATGRDYDPFANTGEALVSGALFGPLFNVMNTRPVRAVPEQRRDSRGNVITYMRAPDGSVITSAGIRQIGEDPALPNYSYIADSPSLRARQTVATRPDEFALSSWWPTEQVERASSPVVAQRVGLGEGPRQVPSAVNTGEPVVGTGLPIPGVQRTSATPIVGRDSGEPIRQPGMGTNNLRNKLAGMPRSFPASQHILALAGLLRGSTPLNARGNADLRRSTGAHYAEISVPPNHRAATLSALENILYKSNTQSLHNWYNNNQIDVLVGAHEALERLIAGEQNAQNGGTASAGPQGGGSTEPASGMGGSDVQGTGGTPDTNLSPDSGEQANGAGAPAPAPEQLSGSLVGGGTPAQERGNVVPAPQDTGASAAPEGTAGTTAEPAIGADGESGTGATTAPDAEGSASAGSAEPAAGARTGDDGNVADTGGNAESGVAPQPERVVNNSDLDTLIEDAATAGGTVAHADETNAASDAPTDREIIAAATTSPAEAATAIAAGGEPVVTQLRENYGIMRGRSDVLSDDFAPTNLHSEATSRKAREEINSITLFANEGYSMDQALANPNHLHAGYKRSALDDIVSDFAPMHNQTPSRMNVWYDTIKWLEAIAMQNTPESRRRIFSDGEWATLSGLYSHLIYKFKQNNALAWPINRDAHGILDNLLSKDTDGLGIGELRDAYDKLPNKNMMYRTYDYNGPIGGRVLEDLLEGPQSRKESWDTHTHWIVTSDPRLKDVDTRDDFLHTLISRAALTSKETFEKLFTSEQRAAMNDAYKNVRKQGTNILPEGAPENLEGWIGQWVGRGPEVLNATAEGQAALFSSQAPVESPVRTETANGTTRGREDNANPNASAVVSIDNDGIVATNRPAPERLTKAQRQKKEKALGLVTRMTRSEVPFEADVELPSNYDTNTPRQSLLDTRKSIFSPTNITHRKIVGKNLKALLAIAKTADGKSLNEVLSSAGLSNNARSFAQNVFKNGQNIINNIAYGRTRTQRAAAYDMFKWLQSIAMRSTPENVMRNFSSSEWVVLTSLYRDLYKMYREYPNPETPVVDRGADASLDDFLAATPDRKGVGELHDRFDKMVELPENRAVAENFSKLLYPEDANAPAAGHAATVVEALKDATTRADMLHTLVSRAALSNKDTYEALFSASQRDAMNEAYRLLRENTDLLPGNAPETLDGWLGKWVGSGGPEVRMLTPESRAILYPRQTTVERPAKSVFDDGGYEPGTAGHALNTMPDNAVRSFVSRIDALPAGTTAPVGTVRSFDFSSLPKSSAFRGKTFAAAQKPLAKEAMFHYLGEGYATLTPKEQKAVNFLHENGVPYLRSELDAATIHDQVREIEAVTGEKMDFDTFYRNFLDPEDPAGPTRITKDKFRTEC